MVCGFYAQISYSYHLIFREKESTTSASSSYHELSLTKGLQVVTGSEFSLHDNFFIKTYLCIFIHFYQKK